MPNSGISEPRKSHQFCGSSDLSNALFNQPFPGDACDTTTRGTALTRRVCSQRDTESGPFERFPAESVALGVRGETRREQGRTFRPHRLRQSSGERRLRATRAPGTRAFAANSRVSNPNPDRFDLRTRHAYRSSIHPTRLTVASPSPPPSYPFDRRHPNHLFFSRVSDHSEWGSRQ